MNILEFKNRISRLRVEKQSFLNDTYLWVGVARDAIRELPGEKFVFKIPKAGKPSIDKVIHRHHREEVVKRITTRDIFNSAFVTIVASIEDYLNKVMTLILVFDSKRLKYTVQGINMITTISIVDFIDTSSEDMINIIINQRLDSLFYSSPIKQLEYFDKGLGVKLEEDIWGKWIEIKARRDLIVHNGGVVNETYVKKSGQFALLKLGEDALINEEYFRGIIADLKSMVGSIDRLIRSTYKIPTNKAVRNESTNATE